MSARLFDRLAAVASMLILIGLGMLSYFLAQQADRLARPNTPRPITHEPDYFVDRMTLLKANAAGEPSVRIEAVRMRHFPDDLTIEFDAPRVVTLTDNRPVIRISADSGRAPDTGEKTDLTGNVRIVREASASEAELVALTDAATVLIERKIVVTDRPVDIRTGPNRLTGIGMQLDSQTRQLRVDSRVKGLIAPREAPREDAPPQPRPE